MSAPEHDWVEFGFTDGIGAAGERVFVMRFIDADSSEHKFGFTAAGFYAFALTLDRYMRAADEPAWGIDP